MKEERKEKKKKRKQKRKSPNPSKQVTKKQILNKNISKKNVQQNYLVGLKGLCRRSSLQELKKTVVGRQFF